MARSVPELRQPDEDGQVPIDTRALAWTLWRLQAFALTGILIARD